jgi:membrane-associated protease RseP (regulator of RpoE activity)
MPVKPSAVLIAGVVSFALGALMFAGEKAPPAPTVRPDVDVPQPGRDAVGAALPYLLAQAETAKPAAAEPDRGWIGLMLEEDKDKGIRVSGVFPAGPAAFAGVRVGDAVVKIGAATPDSITKAVEAIEALAPEKPVKVTVKRDGKTVELTVNAGSLSEFHERYVREMMRRDPRDPNFAVRHGVSDADMTVELVRRLFEQNQRLDRTLHQVLTEVQELRAELAKKK